MLRSILLVGLLFAFSQGYASLQVQMPEAGALVDSEDEGLSSQVQSLQKNITELWTYIHTLRNAVTQHLNHLRQHQVELESTVHKLEHAGEGSSHSAHTDDHHSHSGEHHSHSGEHHSHSGEHHSHSGEHHSHSGEHSHSGDDHQHSHGSSSSSSSGDDHHHDSHSHTSDHHTDDHASHGGDHSSHASDHASHTAGSQGESEDVTQQQSQSEPLVVPVQRQAHSHHHSTPSAFKPIQLMTEHSHHHHHHGSQPAATARNITRTSAVVIPKFSEYAFYDFAICNVQANRAIPEEQQQNINGQITLWQKKAGGPLNIHVRVQGFVMGDHHGAHQALQSVQSAHHEHHQQEEDNETPMVHKHGFHIHTNGDLSNGCQSTGPHYNPKLVNHGAPDALVRHVGDLGNIECDDHGIANLVFSDHVASLRGQYSIIGKSMVIHTTEDDLGLGGDEESTRTGNAGTRIACCVIHKVDKLPIRTYKAMKTAIPRP